MLKSCIRIIDEKPTLFVDDSPVAAMAYTTYFEERSCCKDFIKAGYRIFFVNASFTTAPINSKSGFSPFEIGIFEDRENPDYSELDNAIYKILDICSDAIIFPRINISMPKWWVNSNPTEVTMTQNAGPREALFSEKFRSDATKMLSDTVNHVKKQSYAPRIGGWQICGGMTQEWFHHDLNGSLGEAAKNPYKKWLKENFNADNASLPSETDFVFTDCCEQTNENAKRYSYFSDEEVAKSIDLFAKTIKEETDFEQIVGTFYGYTFEGTTPLFGSHALRKIIDSPNIDFFSSPNAYTNSRAFGMDWADMMPVDSLKLHKKLPFIECDIRTYLTTGVQEARPGKYPDDIYKTKGKSLWAGPPTPKLSREALRKSFAHQLTKNSAIWWFDMWGKWYDDPLLMKDIQKYIEIYNEDLTNSNASSSAEVVFFADEKSWANMLKSSPQLNAIKNTRTAMGNAGAPYDIYMVEDAEKVLSNYKAAVFPFSLPSEEGKKAQELCDRLHIPYLKATPDHCELTAKDIRFFYESKKIHLFCKLNEVIYFGNGYVALHSKKAGLKSIKLDKNYNITPVFGAKTKTKNADKITFFLKKCGTALFKIS